MPRPAPEPDSPAKIRERVMKASEEVYMVLRNAVRERDLLEGRVANDLTIKQKASLVIQDMSVDDLKGVMKSGTGRVDPQAFKQIVELASAGEEAELSSDIRVCIEHYTVPDKTLPYVVMNCDVDRYVEIRSAVHERERKLRLSKVQRGLTKSSTQRRIAQMREAIKAFLREEANPETQEFPGVSEEKLRSIIKQISGSLSFDVEHTAVDMSSLIDDRERVGEDDEEDDDEDFEE